MSKTSKHTPRKTTPQSHPSQPVVFICGESPLVEEFAQRCAAHGYMVYVKWNDGTPHRLPSLHSSIHVDDSIPKETAVACEFTNTNKVQKKQNIEKLGLSLSLSTPILSSSVTITATEQANWIEGKHRLVGVGAFPTLLSKRLLEIAPTIYTPKETLRAVSHFVGSIAGAVEIVEDRIGLVLPRLLSSFINQMYFALGENVAPPDNIDRAIMVSTSFHKGPIAWAEVLTFPQIYATLRALQTEISPSDYVIAPILHQLATTGSWWQPTQRKEKQEV